MQRLCPSMEQVEAAVKAKGYKWFENGDYNLNIVGVRTKMSNNFILFIYFFFGG